MACPTGVGVSLLMAVCKLCQHIRIQLFSLIIRLELSAALARLFVQHVPGEQDEPQGRGRACLFPAAPLLPRPSLYGLLLHRGRGERLSTATNCVELAESTTCQPLRLRYKRNASHGNRKWP